MKRGYFFSIDLIVAIFIIVVGIAMIYSHITFFPEVKEARGVSKEMISLIFDVKLEKICTGVPEKPGCDCIYDSVKNRYCSGLVKNLDLTLLEMIGEMYAEPTPPFNEMKTIINETFEKSKLVPNNYGFSFILTDLSINQTNANQIYP